MSGSTDIGWVSSGPPLPAALPVAAKWAGGPSDAERSGAGARTRESNDLAYAQAGRLDHLRKIYMIDTRNQTYMDYRINVNAFKGLLSALTHALLFCILCLFIQPSNADCGANLVGNFSDCGVDVDNDGLYDYIIIDVGVTIYESGEYGIMGYLFDPIGREIDWSIDHRNFSIGDYTMRLHFNGNNIKKHGVNGHYLLKDLILFSGSSDNNLNMCQIVSDSYITSSYSLINFL